MDHIFGMNCIQTMLVLNLFVVITSNFEGLKRKGVSLAEQNIRDFFGEQAGVGLGGGRVTVLTETQLTKSLWITHPSGHTTIKVRSKVFLQK